MCIVMKKEGSFSTLKMRPFLGFILLKVVEKKNSNGLMEMYRGSQGRVAMTTSIYSTMTCFEFLSVLFEYVIRVLAAQPDNPPGETFGISRVPKCSPAPKEIKKT